MSGIPENLTLSAEAICAELFSNRPHWIKGSLSSSDALFLFQQGIRCRSGLAIELGTASGFSTAVLCHALHKAHRAGAVGGDYRVISYDISPRFYADRSRMVGDAARELLPPDLLAHITFRNPAYANDIAVEHPPESIEFLFIDAHHGHPWPTLDLLATLRALKPDATVVFHDINLPLLHAAFPEWGVNYLFGDLKVNKQVPADCNIPNIGSMTVPTDKQDLRAQLAGILFGHDWQVEVPEEYLALLGVDRGKREVAS